MGRRAHECATAIIGLARFGGQGDRKTREGSIPRESHARKVWTNQKCGPIRKVTMAFSPKISRRTFIQSTSLATVGAVTYPVGFSMASATPSESTAA